ncbi:MAG: dTMP kinase [Verrucomicrobiae bacterium]|nr:dTMP kinase [Verrucomicrobiae bacterium]
MKSGIKLRGKESACLAAVPTGRRRARGMLVTFEGSDGAGKSTQIRRLQARLEKLGRRVMVTREPGGTALGERVRHLLKFDPAGRDMRDETELLLFSASRAQLVREKILPALARGEVVLCDRFVDSTTVYQGFARGLDAGFVERLNRFVTAGRLPDLTVVLDLDAAAGLARAKARTKKTDRMEAQRRSFYEKVRRGFKRLAKAEPRRIKVVSATGTEEEVGARVWKLAAKKMGIVGIS